MFGTKYKTSNTKRNEQNRLQNIHIEIYKYKSYQVRVVLAVLPSTKLTLDYIKQVRRN